jgi:hypothetical protein
MLSQCPRNQGKNSYFHWGGIFGAAVVNSPLDNGAFKVTWGAGKTTYLLSPCFCYGNGYLASHPDLT